MRPPPPASSEPLIWSNDLALSANGQWLATGSQDGRVVLIETDSFSRSVSLKAGSAEVIQIAFQAEGRLVSATKDGELVIWDTQAGEPIGPPAGLRRSA